MSVVLIFSENQLLFCCCCYSFFYFFFICFFSNLYDFFPSTNSGFFFFVVVVVLFPVALLVILGVYLMSLLFLEIGLYFYDSPLPSAILSLPLSDFTTHIQGHRIYLEGLLTSGIYVSFPQIKESFSTVWSPFGS